MRISLWLVDSTRAMRIHGSLLTAANDHCAITRCYHYSYRNVLFCFDQIASLKKRLGSVNCGRYVTHTTRLISIIFSSDINNVKRIDKII